MFDVRTRASTYDIPINLRTTDINRLDDAGGSVFIIALCRSRMIIGPRNPKMPGRSTSGFTDQADISCTKREAKREVSGEPRES